MEEQFVCQRCQTTFSNKYNLSRHMKNNSCKKVNLSSIDMMNDTSISNETSMMMQLLKQMEELKNENHNLKLRVIELENENRNLSDTIDNTPSPTEKPMSKSDLYEMCFKHNPYLKMVTMYSDGTIPKDIKHKYVLKTIDEGEYPQSIVDFYHTCLKNVLENIPNEKLPYKIRDKQRKIFDIYSYDDCCWLKGNTDDLIKHTITPLCMMIFSSISSALCNIQTRCDNKMIKVLYGINIFDKSTKLKINEIQVILTGLYSLPNYDDEMSENDISNFYKRNFISSCFISRYDKEYIDDGFDDDEYEEEYEYKEEESDKVEYVEELKCIPKFSKSSK